MAAKVNMKLDKTPYKKSIYHYAGKVKMLKFKRPAAFAPMEC
jgi:hypothetical protein